MFNTPGIKTLLTIVTVGALVALTYLELKVASLQKSNSTLESRLQECKNKKAVDNFEQKWEYKLKGGRYEIKDANLSVGKHTLNI